MSEKKKEKKTHKKITCPGKGGLNLHRTKMIGKFYLSKESKKRLTYERVLLIRE